MPAVEQETNTFGELFLIEGIKLTAVEEANWRRILCRISTFAIAVPFEEKDGFVPTKAGFLAQLQKAGQMPIAYRERAFVQDNVDGTKELVTLFTFYRSVFSSRLQ